MDEHRHPPTAERDRQGGQRGASGFTLVEIMIVVGIIAILSAGAVIGMRSLFATELRGAASRLAGTMRYLYERALTTGRTYRLVLDLDERSYFAEVSDDRYYILPHGYRGRRQSLQEKMAPLSAEEQQIAEALKAAGVDLPTVDTPGARFEAFRDAGIKPMKLRPGLRLLAVYTPENREPTKSGRAYVYFFPQGFAEQAVIQIADKGDATYSLVVHPLTGRVKVRSGAYEPPLEELGSDDQGEGEQ